VTFTGPGFYVEAEGVLGLQSSAGVMGTSSGRTRDNAINRCRIFFATLGEPPTEMHEKITEWSIANMGITKLKLRNQ
jgi:hypothetical protein